MIAQPRLQGNLRFWCTPASWRPCIKPRARLDAVPPFVSAIFWAGDTLCINNILSRRYTLYQQCSEQEIHCVDGHGFMRLDFVESRWQDRPPDCRLANQITHQEQKREHKLMLVPGPNKCFVWKDGCLTFLRQVWIAAPHWKRLWNEINLADWEIEQKVECNELSGERLIK